MILYVPSTIFQLNRNGSSRVEPELSQDKCVLLKDHNAVTPMRLEPAAPWSRVKHSFTQPLRSLMLMYEVSVYPFFSLHHVKLHCRHIFLSMLIHRCMFLTTTSGQQKYIAATNTRPVPLNTDDFRLFTRKIMF